MTLTSSSMICRHPDLLHAVAGDVILMMSVEAGAYYGVEHVGARVWELIAEPMTIGQICARLEDEYDVTPEACEAEVLAFLGDLAERRIVDVVAQ